MSDRGKNYFEVLANHRWEVETWTQGSGESPEGGVLAMVFCRELGRRILTGLTQLDLKPGEFWDEEWQQMRETLSPVVYIGMPVEPVICKNTKGDEKGVIKYLMGFRPKVSE